MIRVTVAMVVVSVPSPFTLSRTCYSASGCKDGIGVQESNGRLKVLAEWFSTIFTLLRQEFDSPKEHPS